jgi:GntR family transcriptional regulator, transcriptional repressor for pyruvate dehydrogenase complex
VSQVPTPALNIVTGSAALRPLKTSETVAREIVVGIVRDGLESGGSLPSEARMLEQYNVSRESLREGLRLLEAQGLIVIRRGPGGGPSVGTVDPASLGRASSLYYFLIGATYDELFDAWAVAEGYLAERAARNPNRDLVRTALQPYRGSVPNLVSVEEFVLHHTDFHNALGALAGNRVMQLSLMSIGQIVTHHVVITADPRSVREMIEDDHRSIAEAVLARKPIKARDEMQAHVRRVADHFETRSGESVSDKVVEWH